jgi:hypothetical protein
VKKKYFRDYRNELKEKLIREYPGRNMKQVLFDIELDKLKFHELRNEAKWNPMNLTASLFKESGLLDESSLNQSPNGKKRSQHKVNRNALSRSKN